MMSNAPSKEHMRFFDYLMASFPTALQPPEPLVRYFRWVGSQGLGVEDLYALIDPLQNQSCVVFVPVEPWLQDVNSTTADMAMTNTLHRPSLPLLCGGGLSRSLLQTCLKLLPN